MLVKHFSNVDLRRQWDVGGPRIAECRMSSFQSTEIQRKKPVLILLTGSHCNFQTILVIVILSDLPWINSNARFTTVPLKPLSDKKWGKYCRFLDMEVFNYDLFSCIEMRTAEKNTLFVPDQTKVLRMPLWIGHYYLCMMGHLKSSLLYIVNVC